MEQRSYRKGGEKSSEERSADWKQRILQRGRKNWTSFPYDI